VADEHGPWAPLAVTEVVELFGRAQLRWWVAGGRAIDPFLGRETRPHADTDVQVLRRDQLVVQAHLAGWDLLAADPPGALRPWAPGEVLAEHVHDVWCRRGRDGPWALQLMLTSEADGRWVFRREPRIAWPIERLGRRTADGVPYVAPEVRLPYKARALLPKDEADFGAALPLLGAEARRWL